MKAGLYVFAAVALLELATAQIHGLRPKHRHHRREVVTDVVVEEIIIYMDEAGNVISTTTALDPGAASTTTVPSTSTTPTTTLTPTTLATSKSTSPAAVASPPASSPPPAQSSPAAAAPLVKSPLPASSPAPAAAPSAPPPAAAPPSIPESSSSGPAQGPGFGSAIGYSPYKPGACKTASEVAADMAALSSYEVIRLYGSDCNGITNVLAAKPNAKIFAGVTGLSNGAFDASALQKQINDLIAQGKPNWGAINTVSIGNELVNAGKLSAPEVIGLVNQYRGQLRAAGYTGPVVTVDTMVAMKANIGLCTASDYCAINCHPFYDHNTLPQDSGKFVLGWVQQISSLAGGKTTVVTESGWPTANIGPFGVAVASPENQQAAVASLTAAFSSNLILYNSYNNLWLDDSTEWYWGIYGMPSS